MQICSYCGMENPDEFTICLNCASKIGRICSECGFVNRADGEICVNCAALLLDFLKEVDVEVTQPGTLITQEQMLIDLRDRIPNSLKSKIRATQFDQIGQRREITVMVVGIDYPPSGDSSPNNEIKYLFSEQIMPIMVDIIYKYEGTLDELNIGGLRALFGIPINHENESERAVRAALEIQTAIKKYNKKLTAEQNPVALKIGINTDLVVTGAIGDNLQMEYTAVGDTVNKAIKLQEAATPGATLVSFSTYQQTNPVIEYQTISLQDPIKGLVSGEVHQPIKVRPNPGKKRGIPGLHVPMVGRSEYLKIMQEALRDVEKDNNFRVLLINGDAGIGKSRLVEEFCFSKFRRPVNFYQGTCNSYMRITPYRVIGNVVRDILKISESDTEEKQRHALTEYLSLNRLDRSDVLPYLVYVLNIPLNDPLIESRLKLLSPSMLQHQIHSSLRMFLIAEAIQATSVLIFDDLHWVDQASADFLKYFIQSIEGIPILLVMVARSGEYQVAMQPESQEHLSAKGRQFVLDLKPLHEDQTCILANQLITENSEVANQVKEKIVLKSEGNPYYVEELVRILIDYGGLIKKDGEWLCTPTAKKIIQTVPATLRDIILARFDRLRPELQILTQKAAVIGQSFSIDHLKLIEDEEADRLWEKLSELEGRDILIHSTTSDETTYHFKHHLIREVVYDTLLKSNRTKIHLNFAQAVEANPQYYPSERNEILSYHYSKSSVPKNAMPYLLASADSAMLRYANQNAIAHYQELIKLLEKHPKESLRLEYKSTKINYAKALKFVGQFQDAKIYLEKGIEDLLVDDGYRDSLTCLQGLIEGYSELADLHTRQGDFTEAMNALNKGMDLLGEAAYENHPDLWRRIADRIAWVYFRQGKLDEAFRQADLALFDVSHLEQEDPIIYASLNNTLGGIYWMRNSHNDAIKQVENSLRVYMNLGFAWGMAIAYTNMGVLNFSMGEWSKAVEYFEYADNLRKDNGYSLERPTNLKNLGETLICMGEFYRARQVLENCLEISQQLGMTLAVVYAQIGLCRLSIYEEDYQRAQKHLDDIDRLIGSQITNGKDERSVQLFTLRALLQIHKMEYQEALKSIIIARRIAAESDLSTEEVDALRVHGMINVQMKYYQRAEELLQLSLNLSQNQKDRYHQALAWYELGQSYVSQAMGDPERLEGLFTKARRAYKQAIQHFEQLGAKHDLQKAKFGLNQLPLLYQQITYLSELESSKESRIEISRSPEPDKKLVGEISQATVVCLRFFSEDDEAEELISETLAIVIPSLIEIFQANEGYVIRYHDHLTALFGVPVRREDDSILAIDSAIQIINYFQDLSHHIDSPLSYKIGITKGEIIGGLIDFGLEKSFIATGVAVDEANALADETQSAQVWVSQSVRNSTAHQYEYIPAPSSSSLLSKLGREYFQLIGLREQIKPVRGVIGVKTPFIGRVMELESMKKMNNLLDSNQGGLVWIEGEPGIGKSRIMREFTNWLETQRPIQALYGSCNARRSERAFSLFSDLLYQVFELQPIFTTEQVYSSIDKKFSAWPEDIQDILPFVYFLLGLQPGGQLGEKIVSLEPDQLRRQTFIQLRRLFLSITEQCPLLLLLDDLQWIDSISADLLLFISYLTTTHPILILGNQRSTETSASESTLEKIKAMHPERTINLAIKPLTNDESLQLMRGIFSNTHLPNDILDWINQQSSGNPYYIEEFIRMLLEQNYLQLGRSGLELKRDLDITKTEIPSSLEAIIRARVDSLPNIPKRITQAAAILGQAFDLEVLADVSQTTQSDQHLDNLKSRGILVQDSETGYWQLSHPLIESTVYNMLLRTQRQLLHSRAAQTLEERWKGNEADHAEDLAYHYLRANETDKAITYLILAGEREAARFANEEALALFEQANELLSGLSNPNLAESYRIAIGLGSVYLLIGNFDASVDALSTGLDLIEQTQFSNVQKAELYRLLGEAMQRKGDQDAALRFLNQALVVLGTPGESRAEVVAARVMARLGWSNFLNGHIDKAENDCRTALVWAQNSQDPNALAAVENLLGGIYFRQGDFNQASYHTQQAMKNWQLIGYTWGVATSLGNLGILEASAGNWEQAHEYLKQCLELYQQIGDVESIARSHGNLGNLACDRGRLDEAEAHFRDSLAIAIPYQIAWQTAHSTNGLSRTLLYKGHLLEAEKGLLEGIAIAEEIKAQNILAEMHLNYSEILLSSDRLEKAEDEASLAIEMAKEVGNQVVEAGAFRVLAEIYRLRLEYSASQNALQQAWGCMSESADLMESGRLHRQAMRLELDLGHLDEARRHFLASKQFFSQLGANRELALLPESI